jgi:hypothetical protein
LSKMMLEWSDARIGVTNNKPMNVMKLETKNWDRGCVDKED